MDVTCSALWFWTQLVAGPFYLALSRVGEADNPGPVCAKLHDAQFDAIDQWAANIINQSEVELAPLVAQVGACRQNV